MCGIVGFVFKNEFPLKDTVKSLKRLEYRGYDSFGFADNKGMLEKFVGEVDMSKVPDSSTVTAISQTRWATTGRVTKENAHPHTDCKGEITIVHNGIISNYKEIRKEMEQEGHRFKSETDSELIAHFFEGKDVKESIPDFFKKFEGEAAVLLMKKGEQKIYAFKRGSPLALGLCEDGFVLASDIYAFSDKTTKAIFFNEDEFAVVTPDNYEFFKDNVKKMDKQITEFKWEEEVEEKNFDHYMRKEINEIPEVSQRLLLSLENEQKENTNKITEMIKNSKRVVFLASGSSYYAALLGAQLLARAGIDARAIISSEFRSFTIIDENTLAIAVSQSGETMDVIEALRGIKAKGAKIASIVNVPYSTIQRMSSTHINIEAGQEICVAATKTFVNQVITMAYLASKLGYVSDIQNISGFVKDVINQEEKIKEIAKTFEEEKNVFILGKGISYPIAAEIALKLKEISYIHAEGMMGGELKHGTMALIEEGTPVICLAPKNRKSILTNADEVKLRGARVVYFGQDDVELASGDDVMFAISAVVAGQLLTYHIAKGKGLPIDKPRNIAKSVTVR